MSKRAGWTGPSAHFWPVLYVPGNHEFYGGHLTYTLAKMRAAQNDRVRVRARAIRC